MNFDYQKHLFAATVAGSHLYGTATPASDRDIRGVLVPPKSYWWGLDSFEQYEVPGEDTVFHDLRKFLRLSAAGNPAFLEMWWAPQDPAYPQPLPSFWEGMKRDLWPAVLSKRLVKPHLGMAQAHLARITTPGRNCGIKGRDAIEKFGYNTKDACHVIRVLHQALELLAEGKLTFPRPEAPHLLAIKRGEYALAVIQDLEKELTERVRVVEGSPPSSLPDAPDLKTVNRWLGEWAPVIVSALEER